MSVSTWPDISHLSVSRPELINVLRQMGQHVKWPQKMKAPDSLRNPGFWCDFHRDHGHKKEDCVALKIKVNELLKKGHLREFLSEKAKSHLSKETTGNPTEAAPVSPPRQDRVIHVISGGLEICGISHAAATKSTWSAKHGLEAAKPKRLLIGTDEISFMAKEQKKVLTPHHDSLVISLTVANCLVKRILVDNRSSGNIIFQAAYKDLGLEEGVLTRRKMKAPDSLRNPGFWCDFHRDHGHKKEDCIALKIKVNELLKKGHLREFLSEKAKSHLSKETTGKPTEAAPVSPPRQDRVIHVISGGLEICGISHAAVTKSTWNAKHGLEAAKPKRLLLGTDEISFMAKGQKKVLTPHYDSLVISAHCSELPGKKDTGR
ncbi:hypothetical protein F2Q68_00032217 [Brassica cretica]|uniref:Uncharacterized protein n=1 Tax=Brassica cretica TaxID=69181 RepID=A0A8S9GG88_BRACR|nr:hypothetical protein F2Q68_00032217 [Brassica cretica]